MVWWEDMDMECHNKVWCNKVTVWWMVWVNNQCNNQEWCNKVMVWVNNQCNNKAWWWTAWDNKEWWMEWWTACKACNDLTIKHLYFFFTLQKYKTNSILMRMVDSSFVSIKLYLKNIPSVK